MLAARTVRKGFTLVEILIVVVILGILAAIVIPQFTNASESAKSSSLVSMLQTIRSQLELYQVQHSGDYPSALTTNWDEMTVASGGFGPYLQAPPKNPFVSSTVATKVAAWADTDTDPTGAAADETCGWFYNAASGKIVAAGFDEANQTKQ